MSLKFTPEDYTTTLNKVINKECEKLTKEKCEYNKVIKLKPDPTEYKYGLDKKEIINIISELFPQVNPYVIFNELLDKRYLLEFDDNNEKYYRSIYMDLFIRSVNLKTENLTSNYIINPRLILVNVAVPSTKDRKYKLTQNSEVKEIKELVSLLERELGKEDAKIYIEIVNEYLRVKKYNGLDLVQISMIKKVIDDIINRKHIVIEAPTGFGKTEIFLFLILFLLLKYKFDINKRILILYPRKALALDNMNRFIVLSSLIEKIKGVKVPILLRDGDSRQSYRWKDEGMNKNGDKVRGGTLICPNKHELIFKNDKITCSDEKCEYNPLIHILDTTEYKKSKEKPLIIISNMYTIANRFLTSKSTYDINIEDFEKIPIIIMDEMHTYNGIYGGVSSSILEGIKKFNNDVKFVGVSATIPNREKFATDLFNEDRKNISFINSIEIAREISEKLKGEKLYLLGLFEISPNISWHTYSQLWTILASTYSLVYLNNLNPSTFLYQNIVFLNNVYELRRFRDEVRQNFSLGEPCKDRVTNDIKTAFSDPYYIYIPSGSDLCRKSENENKNLDNKLGKYIEDHFDIVFMDAADKSEKFKKVANGEYVAIAATSSLELGVDYEGVSFTLNVGADDEVEIVQRLGRAGRSTKMPKITLGIILSKNVPHQSYRIHDNNYIERLIYMLAGVQLSDYDKAKIGLTIIKNVKPVEKFRNLVSFYLDLYSTGNIRDGKINLCETLPKLKDYAENNIIKTEIITLYKVFCEKNLDCRNVIDKHAKHIRIQSKEHNIPIYIKRLRDNINEFITDMYNDKKLAKLLTTDKKKELYGKIEKVNQLLSELVRSASNYDNLNEDDEKQNVLNSVIKNLRQIAIEILNVDELVDDLQTSKGKRFMKIYKKRLDRLGKKTNNLKELIEKIRNYRSSSHDSSEENFAICENIESLKKGNYDAREFVFNYSSISNVGLNIQDPKLSRNIEISFYELSQNGDFQEVKTNSPNLNTVDLNTILTRFSPFSVVNYSDYIQRSSMYSSIGKNLRYGLVLLGVNLHRHKWNIGTKIARYLSIDVQKNRKILKMDDIKKVKIYNLLQLESKLNAPIVLTSDRSKEFYLKLGVSINDIEDYLKNPNKITIKAQNEQIKYNPLILSYQRTCSVGRGISTDPFDKKCPFISSCSIGKAFKKGNCRYWGYSMKSAKPSGLVFKDNLHARKIHNFSVISPINEVSEISSLFVDKDLEGIAKPVNDDSAIIYLYPKIRITLYDTNAIEIKFDRIITREILRKILFGKSNESNELREILLTKYYLIQNSRGNIYKGIKKLSEFKTYETFIKSIISSNTKKEEFLDFAYSVLLHTLAHLLYEFIILELDIDENFIDYYYNLNFNKNDIYNTNNDNIYIYEKTTFGMLKLSELIMSTHKNPSELLKKFYRYAIDVLSRHEQDVENFGKSLAKLREQVINSNSSYKTILQEDDKIYDDLKNAHIRPDLYSFKLYLPESELKGVNTNLADYLTVADISLGNVCIDGCSSCVVTDYCHYPLYQNLVVSRRLAYYFIKEVFDEGLDSTKSSIKLDGDSDLGFRLINNYAENAKEIRITSAYIDEECLKTIKNILEKNKSISIELTINDTNNSKLLNEDASLIESLKKIGRFKLSFNSKTHAKEYEIILKSNYKISIVSSWNCEKSSSEQNFIISVNSISSK